MEQLELDLGQEVNRGGFPVKNASYWRKQQRETEEYWKKKYDDLMLAYIKLEEKNYALKASVDLLKDVALENGKAG